MQTIVLMATSQQILDRIFSFFTQSHDFNGILLTRLAGEIGIDYLDLIETVKQLVTNDEVSIQSNTNPHIVSSGHYDIDTQLKVLDDAKQNVTTILSKISDTIMISSDSHAVCLYPSPKYLVEHRDVSEFSNRPFESQLALGQAQLKALFFEIDVLDRYYRDPRFRFQFEDYSGEISYHVDENELPSVEEKDQVFLKTFGIGQDENGDRVAVVYLRYLKNLTPDHQNYWKSKECRRSAQMLKEYHENTMGMWSTSYSVFSAFLGEQKALNDLSTAISGAPLFKKTYDGEAQPKEFTFFFIPTSKNYQDFILLLDKMLSDNLNKDFFSVQGVELFEMKDIGNNMVERKEKGTLRLFEEWLLSSYNNVEEQLLKDLFKPLKNIRKERQTPAHKITDNVYDKSYTQKQLDTVQEAYFTLKYLRIIFQRHPKTRRVEIPIWLNEGDIKAF